MPDAVLFKIFPSREMIWKTRPGTCAVGKAVEDVISEDNWSEVLELAIISIVLRIREDGRNKVRPESIINILEIFSPLT